MASWLLSVGTVMLTVLLLFGAASLPLTLMAVMTFFSAWLILVTSASVRSLLESPFPLTLSTFSDSSVLSLLFSFSQKYSSPS